MESIAILIISLGVILLGAEFFVNAIEWLGKLFNLSEGAVGSVLAAVGTALPETIIPIIALLFNKGQEGQEIGIGAILGAPLMLSTLAMFVTGMAVVLFRRKRVCGTRVVADYSTMSRDLGFFMLIFLVAVLSGLIPISHRSWQLLIGILMVISYVWYVVATLNEERDVNSASETPPCYFARRKNPPPLFRVLAQVLFALALIIVGADLFVDSVKEVASSFGVPAFVLALIITPIATELPEKFNSIIWVSREKDTLALGNITGAMVFQSSVIPAVGIFAGSWQLNLGAFITAFLALSSSLLLYIELLTKKSIGAWMLIGSGLFYLIFIIAVVKGVISWG